MHTLVIQAHLMFRQIDPYDVFGIYSQEKAGGRNNGNTE